MKYIKRLIDQEIDISMEAFDAIQIVGPKGCGKTRTASERAKTVIAFEDQKKRENYLKTAKEDPTIFLANEKPILFDEWQDAPEVWDMIRWECDQTDEVGEYFLTGSTSKKVKTAHTGTGRITTLEMLQMSLQESGESNGTVSLSKILNDPAYQVKGQKSNLTLQDFSFLLCRGGWPNALKRKNKLASLLIAKDYARQIYLKDAIAIDGVKRNSEDMKTILASYARNIAMPVKNTTIIADVQANSNISESTFYDYADVLKRLYVIKELKAYSPNIRSKTAIRTTTKKIFYDPSLAATILNRNPEFFLNDLNSFGHFFENLVLRDLMIYLAPMGGTLCHYIDDYGLEIDAILDFPDGNYAAIEIKLGQSGIEEGEANLLKFQSLMEKADKKRDGSKLKNPAHLILIVGNLDTAYTTKSGVKVIPFGCLGA